MNFFLKITTILLLASFSACDIKLHSKKSKKSLSPEIKCPQTIVFTKLEYLPKNKEIVSIENLLKIIDLTVLEPTVKELKENVNKYSSFITYSRNKENLKIISDICIKDINLSATKHEIYFIDKCTIVSRMTKFAYRSKRINSIYYFIFNNLKYVGCIVMHHHTLFHKKDKWVNITNEKVALNWSDRICNNIIKPNLK